MKRDFFDTSEYHQHFSIRKLSIGVASVLLGTTFLAYNSESVHADTTEAKDISQQVSTTSDKNSSTLESNDKSEVENNNLSIQSQNNHNADDEISKNPNSNVTSTISSNESNTTVEDKSTDISTPDSNVPIDVPTKEEAVKALGLDRLDISDDQLAKLGIDRDTYLRNNVKYKATGKLSIVTLDGKQVTYDVKPFHTATGDLDESTGLAVKEKLINDFDDAFNAGIQDAHYIAKLAPYLQGKTIYINKGHELDSDDARRGLPDEYENGYKEVNWDSQVESKIDINTPGTYSSTVDLKFENDIGMSTDAEVVVVDLQGKTIYGSVSDNGEDIDTNAATVVTGYPEGSKDFKWIKTPDVTTYGPHDGVVEVTYPDGTTGTATVHYIISNPQWKTPTPTTPEGKVPDPHDVINLNPGDPSLLNNPETKVTWTNGDPDVSKPGTIDTSVTVTYPDGHTTVIPGQIIVVGTETVTEPRELTRTIIDNVPGQDPIKIHQTVTFTREVTKDDKGNIIKVTDWKAEGPAAWDAYQAHGAAGYTANPASIPAMAVNPDTGNTTVEINYTKNTPSTPDQPTNPSTPQPTDPSQPTSPSAPQPSAPADNNDNKPAPKPHAPAKPSKPSKKTNHKKAKKTVTAPLNGGEKGNGNHGSGNVRPLATKNNGFASNGNKQALAAANRVNKKSALPQTGAKQNDFVAAVGAAVAAVGSLFGLASCKKRY